MRFFNTAGPCEPERHYMLPAAERLPQARRLIERGAYFVVHAPRQMGKTTTLRALADELTAEGRYAALYFTCEEGQPAGDDVEQAQLALLNAIRRRAARALAPELQPPQPWPEAPVLSLLGTGLAAWAQACPLPLVLFFDEIDALQGESLRSVLRQLRAGYAERPQDSPWSVALCGLRDVRDYKVASGGDPARLGTSSPFNIKVESLTLHDFTREQVAALLGQHTAETGQEFLPEAIDRVFALSQGQPWLVNALAQQIVDVLVEDRNQPITAAPVDRARDILIERQDTHLDSLVDRLREPRIRALIEPMLAGTKLPEVPADDVRFAVDLGLVRMTQEGGLDVANPIYREIIVRELAFPVRAGLPAIAPTWLTEDGKLSTERLLEAFVAFWRQHGEPLIGAAPYHEIAPHLALMAFLHRVVNGGGSIEREYAIGRGRMDLCVRYRGETLAIELKVWRDDRPDPLKEGLEQLDGYLAGLGLDRGWLVIFDQRSGLPPLAERTRREEAKTGGGRTVAVIRA
ncbi:AAA family ATPase [Sorangium sp. So ce1153]|uniref:AAA family ATPase n=1 Tax=Sorangium sp. So ce1153 TaxID=3133333 RepID=UPI003F647ED5